MILCYNRGERSSFLAPFPSFRTVAAVRNSYATCRDKKASDFDTKSVDTLSVLMYNVPIKRKGDKKCLIKKLSEIG